MFNTSLSVNNVDKSITSIEVPATGLLQKTCADSIFLRFHPESDWGKTILSIDPHIIEKIPVHTTDQHGRGYSYHSEKKRSVQVLQVLLENRGYYLAELLISQPK